MINERLQTLATEWRKKSKAGDTCACKKAVYQSNAAMLQNIVNEEMEQSKNPGVIIYHKIANLEERIKALESKLKPSTRKNQDIIAKSQSYKRSTG